MIETLKVATDCSGIEAPIQALKQLGIPHRHIWSSDIDKYVIKSIKANYDPEIIFGDPKGPYPNGDNITKRDVNILPDIDLYVKASKRASSAAKLSLISLTFCLQF
jgi:site-specific DNA-cytosine methylase